MNDDLNSTEDQLRALQWRTPSSGSLEESLKTALAARAALVVPRRRTSLLHFIPRSLRFPLAACWTASLIFWWLTPREAASHATTMASHSSLPDSAGLIAQQEATRQLTHELLLTFEDHGRRR
jgi:hypothetical protein